MKKPKETTSKPVAVLISDVHYTVNTLELADKSVRLAIAKANELGVPLIIAGDLHDTKANLRAEYVNRLRQTFKGTGGTRAIVMVGNHDRLNERALEHSLHFLEDLVTLVNTPIHAANLDLYLIPYAFDMDELRAHLKTIPKGSTVIMHQGLIDTDAGEYIQDKTALTPDDVAGLHVVSGHYHKRQHIKLPKGGTWDFIGTPYTWSYAEANDPEKGFRVLMDNGDLFFVPTNTRKHVVVKMDYHPAFVIKEEVNYKEGDLLWVRVTGMAEHLKRLHKVKILNLLGLDPTIEFRLEMIPNEVKTQEVQNKENMTHPEILDKLIESLTDTTPEQVERLKKLWKGQV